jgi:hypothetical protein
MLFVIFWGFDMVGKKQCRFQRENKSGEKEQQQKKEWRKGGLIWRRG